MLVTNTARRGQLRVYIFEEIREALTLLLNVSELNQSYN